MSRLSLWFFFLRKLRSVLPPSPSDFEMWSKDWSIISVDPKKFPIPNSIDLASLMLCQYNRRRGKKRILGISMSAYVGGGREFYCTRSRIGTYRNRAIADKLLIAEPAGDLEDLGWSEALLTLRSLVVVHSRFLLSRTYAAIGARRFVQHSRDIARSRSDW